jgi:hypothetical protein
VAWLLSARGAKAQGTEISPKVRTHPAAGATHATRKNDHGDEEEKGQEEDEVN